jgi:hypothetical protein
VTKRAKVRAEAILPHLTGDVSAVLVVNYFGFPQEMGAVKDLCRMEGVFIIEDNAHGFLGRDGAGRPLGSRGDIGIFSFPKTVYLPDGGGLVVNHPGLHAPPSSSSVPDFERGLHGTFRLKRRVLKTFETIGIDAKIVGRVRRRRLHVEEPSRGRRGWGISSVSRHLLERAHRGSIVGFRRQNYREVAEICTEAGLAMFRESLEEGVCPYIVPILAPPGKVRERVEERLERRGWRVNHWPDLPPDVADLRGDAALWLRRNIMAVYLRPAVV